MQSPCRIVTKTLKRDSQLSFLALSTKSHDMKKKPTSLLVVSLDKTLNGMSPSFFGRQMARPRSFPDVVAQWVKRTTTKAGAHVQEDEKDKISTKNKGFQTFIRDFVFYKFPNSLWQRSFLIFFYSTGQVFIILLLL